MTAQDQTHNEIDNLDVTLLVHEFCSEESRQRPKQQVLREGFRLVATAITSRFAMCSSVSGSMDEKKRVNAFTYSKKPPFVSATGPVPVVKEWGSAIYSDEIFTINDLEEFQTTRFIDSDDGCLDVVDADTISLHEIIPQPHLYPSPFLSAVPPLKGQPFTRNEPMFVAPYSNFSLQDYARVAWLVPIRGVFPWSGCTSASLFNVQMPSSVENDLIRWNRSSLLKFWQFLIDLQKSGSLGSLGVSLHAVKTARSTSDSRRPLIINSTTPTDQPQRMEYRRRCSAVDYFKIYHDAARTFYVRKAIDSWSFGHDSMKVRVLKGARFPLLDEVSTAVLLC